MASNHMSLSIRICSFHRASIDRFRSSGQADHGRKSIRKLSIGDLGISWDGKRSSVARPSGPGTFRPRLDDTRRRPSVACGDALPWTRTGRGGCMCIGRTRIGDLLDRPRFVLRSPFESQRGRRFSDRMENGSRFAFCTGGGRTKCYRVFGERERRRVPVRSGRLSRQNSGPDRRQMRKRRTRTRQFPLCSMVRRSSRIFMQYLRN